MTDFFPRSQARGRTPAEIVESFGYRIWSTYVQVRGGVCPECFGRVDTTVDAHEHEGNPLYTHRSACRECGLLVHMPIEVAAVFHPTAVAFLWEHGLSLLDLPLWELLGYVSTGVLRTEINSSEPFEATVTLSMDDDALVLAVDETSSVTLTRDHTE